MRWELRASVALIALILTIGVANPSAFAGGGDGNGTTGAGVGAGGVTVRVGTPGNGDGGLGDVTGKVGTPGSAPMSSGGDGGPAVRSCGLQYAAGSAPLNPGGSSTQGYWVLDTCVVGIDPVAMKWVPTALGSRAPSGALVAQSALSGALWPAITMTINPSRDRLLVNFPTWLHLASGWRSVTASASVAGVSATVTAKPESALWEMGDGATVTCHSAGTPYDAHLSWPANLTARDCGYSYATSSVGAADGRYTVTVTVHYVVTWASNAGGGGSLGGYDRRATTSVAVGQIESLEN
jgi:hypothetical protein